LILFGADTGVLFKTFDHDWNVKGLIEWPSDGPIFPPVYRNSALKGEESPGAVSPSTDEGHVLNGENDVPMSCGTLQPR